MPRASKQIHQRSTGAPRLRAGRSSPDHRPPTARRLLAVLTVPRRGSMRLGAGGATGTTPGKATRRDTPWRLGANRPRPARQGRRLRDRLHPPQRQRRAGEKETEKQDTHWTDALQTNADADTRADRETDGTPSAPGRALSRGASRPTVNATRSTGRRPGGGGSRRAPSAVDAPPEQRAARGATARRWPTAAARRGTRRGPVVRLGPTGPRRVGKGGREHRAGPATRREDG